MAPGPVYANADLSETPLTSPMDSMAHVQLNIDQPTRTLSGRNENQSALDQSQMQRWWDESVSKHLGVQTGYRKTFVLIIRWDKECDQLKVDKEVSDLRDVFEKRCHFTTETVELGLGNAAEDLDFAVHGFVHKHDDPLNLLIIYYAGHGFFHRSKKLLQLAGSDADQIRGIKFPTVYWNDAEKHLTKSSRNSDILAIMDCCFASDMMRSCGENSRVFEILAASHIGQVTEQPGEHSFTRAFIKSLNYLLDNNDGDGSFDSHQLHEEINRRRIENPSGLWRRLPGNSRHILLRRQRLEAEMHVADAEAPPGPDASSGLLSLQFFLKNNQLSRETIEELTRLLPKSFSSCDAPVRNIKWLGFGSTSRAKSFAGIVKEIMRNKRHMNKQDEEKTSDADGAYESSDAGKRKADDVTIADAVLHKRPRHAETRDKSSDV